MAETVPLLIEKSGIVREWRTNGDGTYTVVSYQPHESSVLDLNKEIQNSSDGYTPSRDMQFVARIPPMLIEYWMTVEGWNPYAPENANKLAALLDSNEFRWLRTGTGRLGKKHRHV